MFRDHPDFQVTHLAPQRPKNYRRQRIRPVRRRALTVTPSNAEGLMWLRR